MLRPFTEQRLILGAVSVIRYRLTGHIRLHEEDLHALLISALLGGQS